MYYRIVTQSAQSLKNVESWLDKAEQHAADKKFDIAVLLNGRLAPDQKLGVSAQLAGPVRRDHQERSNQGITGPIREALRLSAAECGVPPHARLESSRDITGKRDG
jgi:hypothetical protein